MKRAVTTALLVCLAASTLVFFLLWRGERANRDDLKGLAQAEAAHSCSQFVQYQSGGGVRHYWDGTAAFRSFQQAYRSAYQGTNQSANFLICDEVYGYLLTGPDSFQPYLPDLVDAMTLLSNDITDLTGHARMLELRNALAHP